ncbi:alkylphosphonate utilization protein [Mesorhizobium sp. M6A.T.Ce.TU.016.01.1.1]|nr:alkylphosphonate utilization protein [Mesorhizobium sp. M6A.T.Ce.TU.016.01.1.1]
MTDQNDDYVYDDATGEWRPASEMAAIAATAGCKEVRDAAGNVLADGDSVALVKDLKVKGAWQSLKQGTVIKSIRLTDNPDEIDCRHDAINGLVLRTEFVRRRDQTPVVRRAAGPAGFCHAVLRSQRPALPVCEIAHRSRAAFPV